MENNFYVGIICHGRKVFKSEYNEKKVLYSEDNFNYLDLMCGMWYTTDINNRDYVDASSIMKTDISEHREDYLHMLYKYRDNILVKTKIK